MIGLINLDVKCVGARSAGNPHAACDAAGAGNGFTVRLVRHSQRKRGEQIGHTYGIPRQPSTLPELCKKGFASWGPLDNDGGTVNLEKTLNSSIMK